MEPIAAQSQPISVRPVAASAGPELGQLLRDGRVLAGEVLQSLADGHVLIGIGRHKVPAQTSLRLEQGHHFLFQVQAAGEQVLLRILGQGGTDGGAFWRYLRAVIGMDRSLGELLGELAQRVQQERQQPGVELEALGRALNGFADAGEPGADGLRARILRSGLFYESTLFAAAARGFPRELADALGADLKGELLRAFQELPEGPLKEAVGRALAGIEAEQLLNVARTHSGEPQIHSLPLPDGAGWATARLCVQRRRRGSSEGEEPRDDPTHVVVGVDLSRTGPIRIDLLASSTLLQVRIQAALEPALARLEQDAGSLRELLQRSASASQRVDVFVQRAASADLAVGSRLDDIRLLREHHVMDVSA